MAYFYYNANPKGIRTGDCVIRAISYFLGMSWGHTLHSMVDWGEEHGLALFHYRSFYNLYLKDKGYKKKPVPVKGWTVNDFCEKHAEYDKVYMLQCPRHVTIVFHKTVIDTWDCSHLEVSGYWEQ